MKKFLFKAVLLFVLLIISLSTIMLILPKNNNHILLSLKDKNSYLQSSSEKKLVIVGGSNTLFGINSSTLEENFSYNVINMGLHAGLGLRYIINDVKNYLNEGDIVLVIPEYELLVGGLNGESVLNNLIKEYPQAVQAMDVNNFKVAIGNFPEFMRGQVRGVIKTLLNASNNNTSNSNNAITRNNVNSNGDIISNFDKDSLQVNAKTAPLSNLDPQAVKFLNDFYEEMSNKRVNVYMSWPSILDDQYNNWITTIQDIEVELNNKLSIPIISKSSDYKFNQDKIFDTVYHLNESGREIRTKTLIQDLKKVID